MDPRQLIVTGKLARNDIAVSAQADGLRPISQQAMLILPGLAYHGYEGVALEDDEKPRLESTTLWDYPRQSYGKTPKGSNKYAGVTPAFAIYNMVRRYTEPGDLVLTPNWTWHDHFNPGDKNVVWLDVLDIHLSNHLDAVFQENYGEGPAQPIVKSDGYCKQRLGAIRPRVKNASNAALPYTYKWRDTLRALQDIDGAGGNDPHDGVLLEYVHPLTGGPTMPTIGCWVQWLRPGETTKPHRHTSSTIYHVVEGEGITTVSPKKTAGKELGWRSRDCFFVPSWNWHQFQNTSKKDPAIIFSVTDRPVLESLGLFREEA